ncbi:hypothetical protein BC940DRAFT_245031 [Gongronella butleri]|nr:hypothetical protein BC940DRAFT_245031 [Gongronella butleri]
MAFRFNFTSDDLDLEDTDAQDQPLESSLGDLKLEDDTIQKIPCQAFDISAMALPEVIQADRVDIRGVADALYKRTLADVKFQLAQQDALETGAGAGSDQVMDMLALTGNSDLVRGVYEGGFKTWECSLDLVQFLAQLPPDQQRGKTILEIGCGSALPALYMLRADETNHVDVQDYNDQVIGLITVPNILLNTILTPAAPTTDANESKDGHEATETKQKATLATDTNGAGKKEDDDEKEQEDDDDDDEEEEVCDTIDDGAPVCDAEAEIPQDKQRDMLALVAQRSRAFYGDWQGLPDLLPTTYDILLTSETIYSQDALPSLVRIFHKALSKPNGVG